MENIMDHVASYLGVDPLSVREVNLAPTGAARPQLPPFGRNVFTEDILPLLKTSASWEERQAEVAAFNLVSGFSVFYIWSQVYLAKNSIHDLFFSFFSFHCYWHQLFSIAKQILFAYIEILVSQHRLDSERHPPKFIYLFSPVFESYYPTIIFSDFVR